jgi:pyrimidine deaminase RibD-like protein
VCVDTIKLAYKKSSQTPCKFKVCAICYDKRGDLLGISYCRPRFGKKGGGIHAEMMALNNWGTDIRSITLVRFGGKGDLLPIHPCENCDKVLKKLRIKVHTLI